jgi:hypothetical protein
MNDNTDAKHKGINTSFITIIEVIKEVQNVIHFQQCNFCFQKYRENVISLNIVIKTHNKKGVPIININNLSVIV